MTITKAQLSECSDRTDHWLFTLVKMELSTADQLTQPVVQKTVDIKSACHIIILLFIMLFFSMRLLTGYNILQSYKFVIIIDVHKHIFRENQYF